MHRVTVDFRNHRVIVLIFTSFKISLQPCEDKSMFIFGQQVYRISASSRSMVVQRPSAYLGLAGYCAETAETVRAVCVGPDMRPEGVKRLTLAAGP